MAIANVALTNTFDEWRVRTNQLAYQSNFYEVAVPDLYTRSNTTNTNIASAFSKANGVALGANAYTDSVSITSGAGSNAYANVVWSRANSRMDSVGVGANSFSAATISGANTFVLNTLSGSNNITFATIAGANTAVGAGANAYALSIASPIGAGANAFSAATIAGANTAVGAGANARSLINSTATIAGTLTSTGSFVGGTFDGRDDSAAAPAFRFVNAQNMGMYRVSTNNLAFSTASTQRMLISHTGRITGAGTSGSNGFNGTGDRYISASNPSGGQDGDIWYKV